MPLLSSGINYRNYTGVPISVLVRLPRPPLWDSLSVQLDIRTFDLRGLGIRTSTDTEDTQTLVTMYSISVLQQMIHLAYDSVSVLFDLVVYVSMRKKICN